MSTQTFTDESFRTLVTAIARALGTGWLVMKSEIRYDNADADLHHADLGDIGIRFDRQDHSKLKIAGKFVPYRHDVRSPSGHYIGVGAERGAQVIANEIKRRLLPGYTTALVTYRADVAKLDAFIARTAHNAERIRAGINGRIIQHTGGNTDIAVWGKGDIPTLRVSGDNVRFEHMSVSVDVAERILQVLVASAEAAAAGRVLDGERIV